MSTAQEGYSPLVKQSHMSTVSAVTGKGAPGNWKALWR